MGQFFSSPEKVKFQYFPIAARGEVCRLIAAVGGLELEEFEVKDKAEYGSPSGVPLIQHGDLKMSQSLPIEAYLSQIAPAYYNLTPQQRALDGMFAAIKEDVLASAAKQIFGDKNPEEIQKILDKWFPIIEGKLPSSGFTVGFSIPTIADFSLLVIARGRMPLNAAYEIATVDIDEELKKYPKFKAIVAKTEAYPQVKEYLAKEGCTMYKGFAGF